MYVHLHTVRVALGTLFTGPAASLRRVVLLSLFWFGFQLPYTLMLTVLRLIDRVLFGRFAAIKVEAPIFVIANPRSGTTLLHRLLSYDEERFTSLALWHTILPSITGYRIVGALAAADRRVGRPLGRLMHAIERAAFGGWDGVHNMGLTAPEEEEAYFFMTWTSPAVWFTAPDPARLGYLAMLDNATADVRRRMMAFHRSSLQRHLYATGTGNKTLLTKNVLSSGRIRSLLEAYPDARFIYVARHPYEALPSFASMFSMPWRAVAPHLPVEHGRMWTDLGIAFYRHTQTLGDELGPERFVRVRYDELVADPIGRVEAIYAQLGIEMGPDMRMKLAAHASLATRYERRHEYSLEQYGLTPKQIADELGDVFDAWGFER